MGWGQIKKFFSHRRLARSRCGSNSSGLARTSLVVVAVVDVVVVDRLADGCALGSHPCLAVAVSARDVQMNFHSLILEIK